jgi:hypothetical protein
LASSSSGGQGGQGTASSPSLSSPSDAGARTDGGEPTSVEEAPDAGSVTQAPPDATAATDAAQAASTFTARAIVAPPSYMGSVNNGAACSQLYATRGHEPESGQRHPLLLYFVGTNFVTDPATFRAETSIAAAAVTEAMARRGFVALSVDYDNGGLAWLSDHGNQLRCLFGAGEAASVLAVACALPNVDCALGIAVWGHSQGAWLAHMAYNGDPRVRAVWTTGYGGNPSATLSPARLRVVNGEADLGGNASVVTLNQITGLACPDDGRSQCLREDGSGWILVRASDCEVSSADHCWFDRTSCTATMTTLEPAWSDPASTAPFALEPNADWVAETARRP